MHILNVTIRTTCQVTCKANTSCIMYRKSISTKQEKTKIKNSTSSIVKYIIIENKLKDCGSFEFKKAITISYKYTEGKISTE